ncbi:hypothetical protein E6O75_ATG08738 [Venturia nashicola]|uniref:Uncharacterized protein n=1 Tax=Venturia nashicola TaxID=86259 RepID=A0A4Z1P2N5_9PEZI|nr:hypothetical protein E6O75_ATG08738 [Venturia nashicola]
MSPKPLQTIAVNLEKATLCGEKVSRSATWTTLPPYTYLEACTNANQCSSPLEMKPDLKPLVLRMGNLADIIGWRQVPDIRLRMPDTSQRA